MSSRRRKRAGKRPKGRRQIRKRKRPMDFDDSNTTMAGPHVDSLHIRNPVDCGPAIKRMFLWCYNQLPSVKHPFSLAYHLLFPTRHLTGEMVDIREQLIAVREELNNFQQKLNEFELKFSDGMHDMVARREINKPLSSVTLLHPPPLPPPPPPPPPTSLVTRSSLRKASNATASECNVMLQDILNVKLKKGDVNAVQSNGNLKQKTDSMPRITLSDLNSVKLKSTLQKEPEKENETPKSVMQRKTLRQTKIKRSPGGTPLTKQDRSTATGPTPDITRALRRKFKSIRTSPLLEIGNKLSPE